MQKFSHGPMEKDDLDSLKAAVRHAEASMFNLNPRLDLHRLAVSPDGPQGVRSLGEGTRDPQNTNSANEATALAKSAVEEAVHHGVGAPGVARAGEAK